MGLLDFHSSYKNIICFLFETFQLLTITWCQTYVKWSSACTYL